jgi:hypothetical protein
LGMFFTHISPSTAKLRLYFFSAKL